MRRLPLGTAVHLVGPSPDPAFCEIALDGQRGFVACRYLAANRPAPAAPDARWIKGSGVTLRSEPSQSAAALAQLRLNTPVRLLEAVAGSVYCKVSWSTPAGGAQEGFTACQYLASAPVSLEQLGSPLLPDGQPNPEYQPAKAFWVAPSWNALAAYATYLRETRLSEDDRAHPERPRPPDAEFDRMKAHLEKGIFGGKPPAYTAWDEIKRAAANVPPNIAPGQPAHPSAQTVQTQLGLWGPEFDDALAHRAAGLARALELPAVRVSAFKDAADVAPPGETTEQLSGRFGIVHTYRTKGRQRGPEEGWVDGLWDVGQSTTALVKPLVRTVVLRDGRLQPERTHVRTTRTEWGNMDGPMCEGFVFGFSYGDSDLRIWRANGADESQWREAQRVNPAGSLLHLYTREPLPATSALPVVQRLTLDRKTTGFVRGVQMTFDLDTDGVPDLSVFEGTGKGPGHLEGPTTTDDAWYRLFFANIGGRWMVLGRDLFGYGCGC